MLRFMLGSALLFVFLIVVLRFLLFGPMDPFDGRRFTREEWRVADHQRRGLMCRSLITYHLKAGMGKPELLDLLGAPDGIDKKGSHTYEYDIGSWPMQGMDDAYLYVYLDWDDRVVRAEIDCY